jgi:hypothetical protein
MIAINRMSTRIASHFVGRSPFPGASCFADADRPRHAVRVWRCCKLGLGLGATVRSVLLDRACGYLVLIVVYAAGAEVINAGGEDLFWRYGLAICLRQINLLSRPKDSALPGLYIG